MPERKQETAYFPDRYSDLLVGDKHYIADRAIDENLDLQTGQYMGLESATGYWTLWSKKAKEEKTFDTADQLQLTHKNIKNVVVKEGTNLLTEDTDYSVDVLAGELTRIDTGALLAEAAVIIDYEYKGPETVGILMINAKTQIGEHTTYPICQSGGVLTEKLTGIPTPAIKGMVLGLLILE